MRVRSSMRIALFCSMSAFAMVGCGRNDSKLEGGDLDIERLGDLSRKIVPAIQGFEASHKVDAKSIVDVEDLLIKEGFECSLGQAAKGAPNDPYMGCIRQHKLPSCRREILILFPDFDGPSDIARVRRSRVRHHTYYCIP